MTALHELSTAQFKQAIQIREQIDSLQQKLNALFGGSSAPKRKLGRPAGKQKRTMSAESRARMAAGQKARWAKINEKSTAKVASKKATPAKAASTAAPKKKVMSPEAKAKIAMAMKARWAAKKKGAQEKN